MSADIQQTDIAVVGAGMVGAAAALALADIGYQVCLIEAAPAPLAFDKAFISNRVSAITHASQQVLDELAVWELIAAMRVAPYEQMHVWEDSGSFGKAGAIHFDAADLGEPYLGHIVENNVIQLALWAALQAHPGVNVINSAAVTAAERLSGETAVCKSQLTLDNGQSVLADLVVAADGKQSRLRDMLGISTKGWLYDQHALVATVKTAGHQATAWQRFMPKGPLAFLPLNTDADRDCSIVWSTSPEMAGQLRDMPETEFLPALQQASQGLLGEIAAVDSRAVFPLELKHAETYIREGFVLIGDAAHAIHPLAGQGVNLGFEDVQALRECLHLARQQSRNPGLLHSLRKYERQRKGANLTMLAAMDGFKRLFSNDNTGLSLLRSQGLSLVNQAGALKHFLTRYAMY